MIFFKDWFPETASLGTFLVFKLGGNPGKAFSFRTGGGLCCFEDELPPPPPAAARGSLGTKTILLLDGGGGRATGAPCELHAVDEWGGKDPDGPAAPDDEVPSDGKGSPGGFGLVRVWGGGVGRGAEDVAACSTLSHNDREGPLVWCLIFKIRPPVTPAYSVPTPVGTMAGNCSRR